MLTFIIMKRDLYIENFLQSYNIIDYSGDAFVIAGRLFVQSSR